MLGRRRPGCEDPWEGRELTGWRHADGVGGVGNKPSFYLESGGESHAISFSPRCPDGRFTVAVGGDTVSVAADDEGDGRYRVTVGDTTLIVTAVVEAGTVHLHGPFGNVVFTVDPYLAHAGAGDSDSGRLVAPMMGQIIKVNVSEGDAVKAGDIVVVQESMKIEFRVVAPFDGVVAELAVAEGDTVERNSFVAEIDPRDEANISAQQ
jgi:biotin carboxyl carrier protein